MRLHIDLNKEIDDLQVHLDAKNVEIDRLRALNAELVAALEEIANRVFYRTAEELRNIARAAVEKAKEQSKERQE